jgi:hypothetical protein
MQSHYQTERLGGNDGGPLRDSGERLFFDRCSLRHVNVLRSLIRTAGPILAILSSIVKCSSKIDASFLIR